MLLENALIIFLKYPEPGKVKTRLAQEVGAEKAAGLYRLFAEAVLRQTVDKNYKRFVFYFPPENRDKIINWIGSGPEFYPQTGNNLGERLVDAFNRIFQRGAKRVVVIGTDSPQIDSGIILRAFGELGKNQCVIGPSHDGGYYLLGLSSFQKDIFQDIDWSTDKVLKQTTDRLDRPGISFSLLDKLFDIDTISDLQRVQKQ